jgi:chromosome segregation ATPase
MLGYEELLLGIDSAPLVTKMIEDLVSETESMRKQEEELEEIRVKLEQMEAQIEPLQSDNVRLTRENLQLHQQLITGSENALHIGNYHSSTEAELRAENRRLKLLGTKSSAHVKSIQKQIDQMKETLQRSLGAPSMMKTPEVIESDPRTVRKGSRTPTSSRATSVISSIDSIFSAPSISFDPSLFNVELENIRRERDLAKVECEAAIARKSEIQNLIRIRDDEIVRLGRVLQDQTGKDGFLVSLRHKYELRVAEIQQLKTQVRIVNPIATPKNKKRFVLTPPQQMVCILMEDPLSDNGEKQATTEPTFTFIAMNPTTADSQIVSEVSSVRSIRTDSEDERRLSTVHEQAPEAPKKIDKRAKKLEKQLRLLQLKGQALVASKDREICELTTQMQTLSRNLAEKEKVAASLSVDFAYISDSLGATIDEKNQIIELLNRKAAEPSEIVIDTAEIEQLQSELAAIKARQEVQLREMDEQVRGLRELKPVVPKCEECPILHKKLDESNGVLSNLAKELDSLQSRNEQLEVLVRSSEGTKFDGAMLDQRLQRTRGELADRDSQIEKLNEVMGTQSSQLSELQQNLHETEEKLAALPDGEAELRNLAGEIRAENERIAQEIKDKAASIKSCNAKVRDGQRTIKELVIALEKARDDAENFRSDAIFHRVRGEEIAKKTAEQ